MHFEVKIDSEGFKGAAVIDFPTRQEKLEILKSLTKANGHKEEKENEELIDLAGLMGEVIDKRLVSIDVTHEESGIHITDKAFLEIYTECAALTGLISNMIIGGVSLLGKPKS